MASLGAKDPADGGTICGPVIPEVQPDRILAYLALAVEEGGRFATGGGGATATGEPEGGFWIETPVVAGLDHPQRVARGGLCGAVLVAIPRARDADRTGGLRVGKEC